MMEFWMSVWSFVWFLGLSVYAVLAVVVSIGGGYDLAAMLASLKQRHLDHQQAEADAAATPPLPGPPLAES